MIKEELLKKLLKKYGLNPEETIKQNENILDYIDYYEAEQILKYLIKEKKIKPQKIEKAPSILCFSNLQNIKTNYEFLTSKQIPLKKISSCLTVLSTPFEMLEKNYDCIENKLSKKVILESLSTLSIENEFIDKVITLFEKYKRKDILINYPITISNINDYNTIGEIEKIFNISYFKKNPKAITSSVFLRTAKELEEIIELDYFKKNPKKLKGTVFLRTPLEIKDIINMEFFKKYPEKLTTSVFHRTKDEILKIINMPYFKENPERITPSIFTKTPDEIKKIVELDYFKQETPKPLGTAVHKNADEIEAITKMPIFQERPELLKSTVFSRTKDEIEKIINMRFFQKYPEKLTPCVFLRTPDEIKDILKISYFKKHPEKITGSIFHSNAEELKKLLSIEYFRKHPEELKGVVFKQKADEIERSIKYITKELKVPNGIDLCKPLIFIHKKEHIENVINFLNSINPNLLAILQNSTSILNLSLEDIKLRYQIIVDNNFPLALPNGQFNSLFGMPKRRFQEYYGVTFDQLREQKENIPEKKLIITKK